MEASLPVKLGERKDLFDGKTLDGWKIKNDGKFSIHNGSIVLDGGTGWLASERTFSDFILTIEFRFLETGANSGIFVRTAETSHQDDNGWPDNGYQVQCMDALEGDYPLGSLIPYGGPLDEYSTDLTALKQAYNTSGEWNRFEITCLDDSITVLLNGKVITTASGVGNPTGHIGIQGENGRLEFRRIELIPLIKGTQNDDNKTKKDSSNQILDLTLEAPEINTSPGPAYSSDVLDYAMVLGIDRTPGGRLWASWIAGGDNDEGILVAATSDDGGTTWSTPRLVIDPRDSPIGLRRRVLVGNFWTDPNGKLWLFFDQSLGYFDGRAGVWVTACDNPDSENPIWSKPKRIWHGATLCKPVVLENGEWLLPVSLWTRNWIRSPMLENCFHELDGHRMAHVFVSKDQGDTWTRRGSVAAEERRFDEHMIVELKDGRLWMLIRTKYGIAETYSKDKGRTWTDPVPSQIKHVEKGARIFLRQLDSGNLLLVKHGKIDEQTETRSHLTAFLSADEGKTWRSSLLIDERTGVSYPDGFQSPDGTIYMLYDRNRAKDREILLAKFTEEDIRTGKFETKKSHPPLIVHKAMGNLDNTHLKE